MNFWDSVIANCIGGVAAGFVVSLTLLVINRLKCPRFQFIDLGNGLAEFRYNGYLPIIVGGSFSLGFGPVMITQDRRGGTGGFYFGPMAYQVFATPSQFEVGETCEIIYRFAPLSMFFVRNKMICAVDYEVDAAEILSMRVKQQAHKGKKNAPGNKGNKQLKNWRVAIVSLQPHQTLYLPK